MVSFVKKNNPITGFEAAASKNGTGKEKKGEEMRESYGKREHGRYC